MALPRWPETPPPPPPWLPMVGKWEASRGLLTIQAEAGELVCVHDQYRGILMGSVSYFGEKEIPGIVAARRGQSVEANPEGGEAGYLAAWKWGWGHRHAHLRRLQHSTTVAAATRLPAFFFCCFT